MSERYTQLYALKENLYTKGSPVILSAGRLLKDNQTGMVLAQLKIKNISDKTVKAAKVVLHPLDTIGKPINGDAEKEYLDLEAEQGREFGQKEPIFFPNLSTRGFTAEVIQVIFADNRIWESSGVTWEKLPEAERLSKELNDPELLKQYRIEYGEDSAFSPQEYKDLWLCKCGTWNNSPKCYNCEANRNDLLPIDRHMLLHNRDERLEKEKEETEKLQAEKTRRADKTKKTLRIAIPVVLGIIVLILLATKVIAPEIKTRAAYNNAVKLMESGDYGTAITVFEALDGYKDSEGLIEKCNIAILDNKYESAKTLMESDDYIEAITIFNELGDYKDSAELAAGISDEVKHLGNNYYSGEGVKQDYREAVKLYRLAAEAGNASAQRSLGYCYQNGEGVILDYTEAVKWYRLAADQGFADAQNDLGHCYQNGEGVNQDYTEAVKWYRLAADQGLAVAQYNLGYCYDEGIGVNQDYTEAAKWYRLAADQGLASAQCNLGYCFTHGYGVTKDYNKGVEYYILAARQGDKTAIDNLKIIGEPWE